jgi:hypothetical protein
MISSVPIRKCRNSFLILSRSPPSKYFPIFLSYNFCRSIVSVLKNVIGGISNTAIAASAAAANNNITA